MINPYPKPPAQQSVVTNRRRKETERGAPAAKIDAGLLRPPSTSLEAPGDDLLPPTGLPSDYKAYERILAPIPGAVTRVFVTAGEEVKAGEPLLVIEAMKSRNMIRSGYDLRVVAVHVQPGEVVKSGQLLVEFGG